MDGHIERGSLVRLNHGKGLLVCVLQGELWVTQEGDPRDYLVRAGERLRLERRGVVVASALNDSRVRLCYGDAPDFARRMQATAAL